MAARTIDLRKYKSDQYQARLAAADARAKSPLPFYRTTDIAEPIDQPDENDRRQAQNTSEENPPDSGTFNGSTTNAVEPISEEPDDSQSPPSDSDDTSLFAPESVAWRGLRYYKPTSKHRARIIAGGLLVIAALFLLLSADIMAAFLFVLCAGFVIYRASEAAHIAEFEVNIEGVRVDGTIYPYEQIESFWIQYEPEYGIQELSLHMRRRVAPYLKIPIYDQDPVQIRSILIESIPEEQHHETIVDTLIRGLGV